MNYLVLDTSTEWCSVALWCDGEVRAQRELAGQRHSALLLPMVDALLRESALGLTQLNGIAYGAGPGSFTGLRIACAVTQGLALGADLPVVGVSTLESLAEQADAGRVLRQKSPQDEHPEGNQSLAAHPLQVLTVLDARMAEVYWAAYQRERDGWQTVIAPQLALPTSVQIPAGDGWVGAGNGFAVLDAAGCACVRASLVQVDDTLMPDAAAMAPLAARAFARGEGLDAALAAPIYLRDKVALTIGERRTRKPQ
jgi:tRNA threonylcarbamoyladenosine biosynthesis protein TsaB